MKILFVIPALGSSYGGTSKCVMALAQALGSLGISVDLIATNANGSESMDVPLETWLYKESYRIRFFPCKIIGDYKFSLSFSRWLFQNIQNYDLVQTNAIFSIPNLAAYWACKWKNIPYVVVPHGMLDPWALSYKARKKLVYYTFLEKPALKRASALQALAPAEAQQIHSLHLGSPVIISPNGVHQRDFESLPQAEFFYEKFPETKDKTLILFLGRIDPKKGLDLLAQAFKKAKHQFPHSHLIVAGPDNVGFLSTAKQYFAENNCLEAVTFTGMLNGKLKYSALAAADYYIAPSYSEGFSMSVLEGMAAGLPCIITTGCNFPEAQEARAAYVTEINAESLSEALCTCLEDPQAAAIVGKRAKEFIFAHYTWDEIATNLADIYQSIVSRELFLS